MSVNKVLKRPAAPGGEVDTHETWFQPGTLPECPCTASEGRYLWSGIGVPWAQPAC